MTLEEINNSKFPIEYRRTLIEAELKNRTKEIYPDHKIEIEYRDGEPFSAHVQFYQTIKES